MKNPNIYTQKLGSNFNHEMFEEEVINYGWNMNDVLLTSYDGVEFITYDVSVLDGDILIEMLVESGMLVVF